MMMNMFSMFDPSSSYNNMIWYITMIPMMIMANSMMKINNKPMKMINTLMMFIKKEMVQLMKSTNKKSSTSLLVTLFIMVMLINIFAMIPHNFSSTAHLSISLTTSLTMWTSIIMGGWINSFKSMMAHLTPTGTPNKLMNFMVLIELVSNTIRPITLSVRLSANMVAGHLLMSLLSNFSMESKMNTIMSSTFLIMLTLLEMMVAMVQSYVLMTLIALYHNESVMK